MDKSDVPGMMGQIPFGLLNSWPLHDMHYTEAPFERNPPR